MLRCLWAAALLIVLPVTVFGQAPAMSGLVRHRTTGQPIECLHVALADSLDRTVAHSVTDSAGMFVLVAPDAKKVAVVGDFNGWDASHSAYQAQHRGGGVWSVMAPVPVGHHRYSFVVDDSLWVADPSAPRVVDNDFGMTNSAIVVEEQR